MFQRPGHPQRKSITPSELSEARFRRFMRELNTYERQVVFEETLNTFLDLYGAWLKTREPWMKIRVVMLAFELHQLDPKFEFNLAFTD